jgi:hypothetical protein
MISKNATPQLTNPKTNPRTLNITDKTPKTTPNTIPNTGVNIATATIIAILTFFERLLNQLISVSMFVRALLDPGIDLTLRSYNYP